MRQRQDANVMLKFWFAFAREPPNSSSPDASSLNV